MVYLMTLICGSILTFFSLESCSKKEAGKMPDDILSLKKTSYMGKQLKLDGYYYVTYNGEINGIYFLFNNGVFSYFGASGGDFVKADGLIRDPNSKQTVKNNKDFWGLFLVDGNNIKMEQWHPINAGEPLRAYVRSGTVLNDTTFQMTEVYRMQNGQKTEISKINEIYKIHTYSPKPDSTNNFIP